MFTAQSTIDSQDEKATYILASLGECIIVFPSSVVAQIIFVESSRVLALPFYPQEVIGCVHHQGKMIPLVSLAQILGFKLPTRKQKMIVIHLNEMANKIAGIGLLVERIVGTETKEKLPAQLFTENEDSSEQMIRLFSLKMLKDELWQPKRFTE